MNKVFIKAAEPIIFDVSDWGYAANAESIYGI